MFQQVRKLENELGVRLFEQVSKAETRLTAAGRQLYEHAAPFFEQLPAVERALKAARPVRELRLAAEALILQQVLPRLDPPAAAPREPDLLIDVRELAAPDLGGGAAEPRSTSPWLTSPTRSPAAWRAVRWRH